MKKSTVPHSASGILEEWAYFVRERSHVLSQHPELLFQEAANQPDSSLPARAAHTLWSAGRYQRSWLRWITKPERRDPVRCTLHCEFWIHDCTFTADGKRVITRGKGLKLWDVESGALIGPLTAHPNGSVFALSADGRRVVSASAGGMAPPAPGETTLRRLPREVRVWDLESGDMLGTVEPAHPIISLAFSPDGRMIAMGDEELFVTLWDAKTLREIHRMKHWNKPQACAFSPDGSLLVAAGGEWSHDRRVPVWNTATGQLAAELTGHSEDVFDCAFSPDGRRLVTASNDGTLRIWDLTTGQTELTLTGHEWHVRACDWSADGRYILSGSFDKTVRLWSADAGVELAVLARHKEKVFSCAFSPDGTRIVSGDQGNVALVSQVEQASATVSVGHGGQVTGASFSPDGTRLATTSYDGTVRFWDVVTGAPGGAVLRAEKDILYECAWSPDAGTLAAASHSGYLILFDLASGSEKARVEITPPNVGHVHSCSFSPDGQLVAAGAIWIMAIFDVHTLALRRTFEYSMWTIESCPFSPDGRHILDSTLQIWDVMTGARVLSLAGENPDGIAGSAFSPDGSRVAATHEHGFRAFDAHTGAELLRAGGHRGRAKGIAFTRDGRLIASTSGEGDLLLHDALAGELVARFVAKGRLHGVGACDRHVACGDSGGQLYLLEIMKP